MEVKLKRVEGIDDALLSMYFSKQSYTQEWDHYVRSLCKSVTDENGFVKKELPTEEGAVFEKLMEKLTKFGARHITLLRFINFSFVTTGIHRGAQDDIDAHAKRFDNRIIRASTRLGKYTGSEKSDFYEGKIMTLEEVADMLGVKFPEKVEKDGSTFVRQANGYVLEGYETNKDYRRGLYMLSIPSDFIAQINLTEWAHVYKERGKHGGAHPEVKEWAEQLADEIEAAVPWFNRRLFMDILN